ncbi:19708_t:CDS:2 [Entrophospora sp. SA101]|nr:13983_t:CDS:2 [Entrophospora sp. SA101]CAJ0625951.1 1861_t:CDS:2 [Entrophospora sp. SA101]CAJ0748072.1 7825_t:CDS:2 [Entrophospora sp. SA101]CAJ0761469.1 19461_t:CDS:2 [Entrophospora sp. SA101]CAJ0761854.1 9913_t:CDS:2 [Entrophospora sp. SA101]
MEHALLKKPKRISQKSYKSHEIKIVGSDASINQTKPLCDYGNINNHGKNYSMTNNTILTDQVANANPDDDSSDDDDFIKLYDLLRPEDYLPLKLDFVVPKLNPLVDGGTQVKNDDYDDNSNRKRPGLITIDYLEKKLVKLNSIITQEDLLKFAHFTNTTSKYDNAAISSNRYYNNHNKSIIGIKRKNTNLKTSETSDHKKNKISYTVSNHHQKKSLSTNSAEVNKKRQDFLKRRVASRNVSQPVLLRNKESSTATRQQQSKKRPL